MKPDFDNSILAKLFDRTDGIKLITEAHTHKNAVGKYREYVRLFKRAFQRPFTMLAKKLNQFLGDSKLDYSLDEINKWISFRHQVTHADNKGKYKVIIESDIQKYIPRIEQAAYDVLLNKKKWNDFSKERQLNWEWDTTILKQDETVLRAKAGKLCSFQINLIDEFDSYLCDMDVKISYPENWWVTKKRPEFPVKMEILP